MPDRYQPLRDAIAAGPTKGPWRAGRGKMRIAGSPTFYSVRDEHGFDVVFWTGFDRYESKALKGRNSRYIAAADPDTIAALLADNDRLQRELEFIAYANPSRWDADMRDQFQEWAQNRARAALADGETK